MEGEKGHTQKEMDERMWWISIERSQFKDVHTIRDYVVRISPLFTVAIIIVIATKWKGDK